MLPIFVELWLLLKSLGLSVTLEELVRDGAATLVALVQSRGLLHSRHGFRMRLGLGPRRSQGRRNFILVSLSRANVGIRIISGGVLLVQFLLLLFSYSRVLLLSIMEFLGVQRQGALTLIHVLAQIILSEGWIRLRERFRVRHFGGLRHELAARNSILGRRIPNEIARHLLDPDARVVPPRSCGARSRRESLPCDGGVVRS